MQVILGHEGAVAAIAAYIRKKFGADAGPIKIIEPWDGCEARWEVTLPFSLDETGE